MMSATPGTPAISSDRLWVSLARYARLGATADGGVDRPVFSEADRAARALLQEDCHAIGLANRTDAAANLFAMRGGTAPSLPAILIGSHLDSVPDGGRYDGPLGVLCGLEVLTTLQESGYPTRHPVGLVSLTGEEATSFGTSTFGSRALAGRLPDLSANVLPDERTVRQALDESGGNWEALAGARAALGPVACFIEVHIEQGRRLERADRALGVVSAVTGIHRQRIDFTGRAGHAGTTAMGDRHDALRAAARLILAVAELPSHVAGTDPEATATVGTLTLSPNTPNVIPAAVSVVTDLRAADAGNLAALAAAAEAAARQAAEAEAVGVRVVTILDQQPIVFDQRLRAVLLKAVRAAGGSEGELSSQAGHDSVHMQALAPAGMIFVRCRDGISHHPDESVTMEDAAAAAQALLDAVVEADMRL